ncbi:MAG: hypothetical protein M3119_04325 [Verrucomicrobiota bacterium]|nr:hypothetical protein [Verrucomicrobiota bacterium]
MKIALVAVLAVSATALGEPRSPSKPALDRYEKELDHLDRYCMKTDCFSDDLFWRESRRVARRTDPGIIHAIMLRSRRWRGEEGLVFVPLIAFLPRAAATKVLRDYEHSKRELDRIWVREFFIELNSDDVKEAVQKLSGSHE